jgi:membrane protease YdiL (CAAX protease family)
MSILAATLPPNPPSSPTTLPVTTVLPATGLVLLLLVCVAIIGVAIWTGVFKPRQVIAPDRVPPGRGELAVFLVMAGGFLLWLFLQAFYASYRLQQILLPSSTAPAILDLSLLSPADYAVLATAPSAAALIVLLIGDWSISPGLLDRLGIAPRHLTTSLRPGGIAVLFVVPFMLATTVILEAVYNALRYEHPKEHELLKIMGESSSLAVRGLLIVGATVMAPLFEEVVFRGHLQSLVRSILARMGLRHSAASALSEEADPELASSWELGVVPYQPADASARWIPSVAANWLAIVLTSICFALVHPAWTWPVIFVLSLCLGYAYERTQKLWVPIIIHASFNLVSTILFLATSG